MNKPYVLLATVNGHDMPAKGYKTERKAQSAMQRLMDRYDLQMSTSYKLDDDDVYRMEQYRTWFHIQHKSCKR